MIPTLTDTPTTWAGLAPTHNARPVYYELAQAASEDAWQDVSDAVDAGEPSDMVYERQQAALICDQLKADQYRWWMSEDTRREYALDKAEREDLRAMLVNVW